MAKKISYKTPIVEMQGDEMTRVLWDWIKDILIEPFVELNVKFFDLGLPERERTKDRVTHEATEAIKEYGVGVKCATITPNAQRVEEYNLSQMWLSPNGTIRAGLDGTVFRAPILVKGITPLIPSWTKPIIIARHAYGDVYRNCELKVGGAGKAELVFTDLKGNETRGTVAELKGAGVLQGIHNTDASIESFARACFRYGLSVNMPVWFATKDTISKTYDRRFKDIFQDIFDREFSEQFKTAGIYYDYTLIDDSVARIMRSDGGMVWALKNYDGDVMSDMVATAYGSLAMMTSVLCSPDGKFEFEAAHGTVTRHFYKHREGAETSTNSVATIFAWTGALRKRGELDQNAALVQFAERLEKATLSAIEQGFMTGDLIGLFRAENIRPVKLSSRQFLEKVAELI